jgi:branched-chain amino acid transport system permease protein
VLLVVLRSIVGSWTEHHLIVIGLLFMGSVLFLPRGLMSLVRPWLEDRLARRSGAPTVVPPAREEARLAGGVEP